MNPTPTNHALAARLRRELQGEVLFDRFSRGRYSTDASHYQIEPLGVVVPRTDDDVRAALALAREEGVPLLPRGGGTSQSGQTVGRALVIDYSKHLNRLVEINEIDGTCVVEPGIVLDELNRQLRQSGLWFPVDVSTSSRATIGGMGLTGAILSARLRLRPIQSAYITVDYLKTQSLDQTLESFSATDTGCPYAGKSGVTSRLAPAAFAAKTRGHATSATEKSGAET